MQKVRLVEPQQVHGVAKGPWRVRVAAHVHEEGAVGNVGFVVDRHARPSGPSVLDLHQLQETRRRVRRARRRRGARDQTSAFRAHSIGLRPERGIHDERDRGLALADPRACRAERGEPLDERGHGRPVRRSLTVRDRPFHAGAFVGGERARCRDDLGRERGERGEQDGDEGRPAGANERGLHSGNVARGHGLPRLRVASRPRHLATKGATTTVCPTRGAVGGKTAALPSLHFAPIQYSKPGAEPSMAGRSTV